MKLTKYTTIPFLAAILAGVAVEATPSSASGYRSGQYD